LAIAADLAQGILPDAWVVERDCPRTMLLGTVKGELLPREVAVDLACDVALEATARNAVMKPTANGRSVRSRTRAICARTHYGPSAEMLPKEPSAPLADTAVASVPPLWRAIGADIRGC
jgi:hypothetical protein